jgi:hypothetical protein
MTMSLLDIIAQFELGKATIHDLSDWATEILLQGKDTRAVVLLAGITQAESDEIYPLLHKIADDLGVQFPSAEKIKLAQARLIARDIVEGRVEPNDGCDQIAEINGALGWPDELIEFAALAHEQTGHESLGITKENVRPHIINAAKKLVAKEIDQ